MKSISSQISVTYVTYVLCCYCRDMAEWLGL